MDHPQFNYRQGQEILPSLTASRSILWPPYSIGIGGSEVEWSPALTVEIKTRVAAPSLRNPYSRPCAYLSPKDDVPYTLINLCIHRSSNTLPSELSSCHKSIYYPHILDGINSK